MNISEHLTQTNSLAELVRIAQNAEAKISFWGGRYVSFTDPAYEGTLDVDDLAARVIQIAKDREFAFTTDERVIGRELANRITQIYVQSDNVRNQSNCFTKIITLIRAIAVTVFGTGVLRGLGNAIFECGFYSHTHWIWSKIYEKWGELSYEKIFDYYPEDQFQREFNMQLKGNKFEFPEPEYNGGPLYYHAPPQVAANQQ